MALGSKEEKLSKQCKILKEKIVRKEKLILLLKELVQVKDKTTHENISQQLLTLRARSQEANSSLKKELLLSCNCTKKIVQLQDVNRKAIEELSSSLEDKRGTIAHLEFQNKQLIIVERQHEKTIDTLKESIKSLEKKPVSCNCVFKSRRRKLKDKSLEDPPPTPASSISSCPETSKSFPQQNLLTEGILTPASSISSSIPVADGPSSPGIGWLDLDSRSNSPTASLPGDFVASHDPVPPLLTPIQSASKKPLHDDECLPLLLECDQCPEKTGAAELYNDQSTPLLSGYGHCSEQLDVAEFSGGFKNVEVRDNQFTPVSGCSNAVVEDPHLVVDRPHELVNSDESPVIDRLSLKSQSVPAISIFDLPLDKPECEDVRSSDSRKGDVLTKPNSDISFLNSFSESFCNDLGLSDCSELDSALNLAMSDVRKPGSSNLDSQVDHPTDNPPIKKEFDKPEDGVGLKKLSLPSIVDCVYSSGLPQETSLIEPQSNINLSESEIQKIFDGPSQGISEFDKPEDGDDLKKLSLPSVVDCVYSSDTPQETSLIEHQCNINLSESENQTMFGGPCQGMSDTDLIEETTTGGNAPFKELQASENLTMECSEDSVVSKAHVIDVLTQTSVVIIGQSTHEQALEVEMETLPVHSPIPALSSVPSDESSPEMGKDELSSNERPTSFKPKPSFTSTARHLNRAVGPGNDSSSEIGGIDSENYLRLTRSKSITPKNTPQKITRQHPKELTNTIDVSPKKSTRKTRLNSTPKSEFHAPDLRRSSRINSSLSSSCNSPLKRRPLNDCVQPIAHSLISPTKSGSDDSAELTSSPERRRPPISLKNAPSSKSSRMKVSRKTSSQKLATSTTSPKSIYTPDSRHQNDVSGELTNPVSSTISDTHQEIPHTKESEQLKSLSEPEVRDSASFEIHTFSTSKSCELKSSSINSPLAEIRGDSSDHKAACMQKPNEEKCLDSRLENVISPAFNGFEDLSPQVDCSLLAVEGHGKEVVPPLQRSPITDSPLGQISETSSSKSSIPKAVQPSIPIMRNGNNILCSASAAFQTFSSTFSKSFDACSNMFGARNLPSFSDLKKPLDNRSSSDQYWSGGAFSPKDAVYWNYRQGKNVDEQSSCNTPEADVDNLRVGHLCLSFNLLSLNPSPNNRNDNIFNFFSRFKKEKNVDEYSSLFFPSRTYHGTDNHGSGGCSDGSKFTSYRDGAGNLNESSDTNSEVTIEIKQEDSPFSLKLSVPAGKPLEPVFDSLCGMVREVQSKNTPFSSCRHHPRSSMSDSGSTIPIVGESSGSFHRSAAGVFEKPKNSVNSVFPDGSIRSERNEHFINANHQFKIENKTMPSCQWADDVLKRHSFSRVVVSPNLRGNSTFSASKSKKLQSNSNKSCQSHVQLKASRLGIEAPSIFDDSNKQVNHLIKGFTAIASPLDNNSVVFPKLSGTLVHPTTILSQNGGGSESYDLTDSKSVVIVPFDSAQENRNLKANCVTTVNPSTSGDSRNSPVSPSSRLLQKGKTAGGMDTVDLSKNYNHQGQCDKMAGLYSDVNSLEPTTCDTGIPGSQFSFQQPVADDLDPPHEDSKLPSIPVSPPPEKKKTVSPNLKRTSSACEKLVSCAKVNSKKRTVTRSPCKGASKPKKLCLSLTEEQKSEVFSRQSSRKLKGTGSLKKIEIGVMNPPATSSLPRSHHVSPDQKQNLGKAKQSTNVKRKVTRRVSPKKLSVETIAVSKTDAKAFNVEGFDREDTTGDRMKCPQCQRKTATCLCEIERIMEEMTHFCSAPLSPIRETPESDDLESTLLCVEDEPSRSGGLENKKTSESEYISGPFVGSVHDSSSVQTSSSPTSTPSKNELGMLERVANDEKINDTQVCTDVCTTYRKSENGLETRQIVTNYEMGDSGEHRSQALDPPTEKIDGSVGEPTNDSLAIEKSALEDSSVCTLTSGNYLKTREIVSNNYGMGDSRDLENCRVGGSVGESEPLETCGTEEDASIGSRKRRRKTYELNVERRSGKNRNDGVEVVNNLNVENCTPDRGNSTNCNNLKKNPEIDELREVPTEKSAILPQEQCELNVMNDVAAKNETDVLSNIPALNTGKPRLRCSILDGQKNCKRAAPKRTGIGRAVRRRKQCSTDENSENYMESDQVIDLAPGAAAENHSTTHSGCLESNISSPKSNKILDVEDRGYDNGKVERSTDSFYRDADLSEAVKTNQIRERKSATSEIDKSVDELLESISTVPGRLQSPSCIGRLDHQEKSQPVGSRTPFNPLSHLGKFFERSSSAFQPVASSVGGPDTNVTSKILPSGSDGDSESEMVVDYSSCSESEPKETLTLLTPLPKDEHEPKVSLLATKNDKTTSIHSDTTSSHQPGFYIASQQRNNSDGNNKPSCSETMNSCQSTPAPEPCLGVQFEKQPCFYVTSQRNNSDGNKLCCSKTINSCKSTPASEPSVGVQFEKQPGFYVTSQRNNSDGNKQRCSKTINSCQSTPPPEPSPGMQLPNFYSTTNDESEIEFRNESEPKRLIKISHYNKNFREAIREEDIIPCSINMLAFASFYELDEPEEKLILPEPYKKHQERIENCLNEFFLCLNLEEGLKKAVSTLHKLKPCHVGKGLCAVVGESNPKIQAYEKSGLASFFTKIQKKAVLLVTDLAKGRVIYFNDVLSEIEEFLIPSPKSPSPNSSHAIINLASLYALICRTQGFGVRVQSFIYDLLYGRHISSFRIINQILLTIPQVIPWAQDSMGPLTYTIVYLIMKHGIYQNLTPQFLIQSGVTPLRNRLRTKYRYSFSPDLTRETVMDELMSNVLVKGSDKAIVLLSKSQGYRWTYTVVQKHIFPAIDKWIKGEEDEDYVVAIIKLLGLMSRCFAISVCESFVSSSLENLKRIIQKNPSLPVAEAVTDTLVHFRRLKPEGVITILANWTPHDYKVTKACVRTLKKITTSKPYSYWKQFMTP